MINDDSRVVRAWFDDQTIRVYQAYRPEIAKAALRHGKFVSPFKRERMTWIKPSFNWMMYRSGHASKAGQEMVLAIDILRSGFEWALAHASLSAYQPGLHVSYEQWRNELATSPVRVQWDPERDWKLATVPRTRAIQIGLQGEAVDLYADDWTVRITDATPDAMAAGAAANDGVGVRPPTAPCALERIYPLPDEIRRRICST